MQLIQVHVRFMRQMGDGIHHADASLIHKRQWVQAIVYEGLEDLQDKSPKRFSSHVMVNQRQSFRVLG